MPKPNQPIGAKRGPSRLVIYTLVGAIAAYALFLYTQPETPAHKTVIHITRSSNVVDANGFMPIDYTAHFPRYVVKKQDPFAPLVVQSRPQGALDGGSHRGGWALTGINNINGVATALVENSATGESDFLKPGDSWNGLRVGSVRADSVVFVNALGQETHLAFNVPNDDPKSGQTLPPLPILPSLVIPGAPPLPYNGGMFQGGQPLPNFKGNGLAARTVR